MVEVGQITEAEAETHSYRNVLLQSLGAHTAINVEVNALTLRQHDVLVLCSDGLFGKVRAAEMAAVIKQSADCKSACRRLIGLANERGGEDNITVMVAQFSGSGLVNDDGNTIELQSIARSPDTPTEAALVYSNLKKGT